jgi:hypothetical protein
VNFVSCSLNRGKTLSISSRPPGFEVDDHAAPVFGMAGARHEARLLESAQHPAQGPLCQPAVVGELAGLPLSPYPEDEENGEPSPGQPFRAKHFPFHPVPHRGGGAIDVGNGEEGVEVELAVPEPGANVSLRLEHDFGIMVDEWSWHGGGSGRAVYP